VCRVHLHEPTEVCALEPWRKPPVIAEPGPEEDAVEIALIVPEPAVQVD
jgi:hypothetical protein